MVGYFCKKLLAFARNITYILKQADTPLSVIRKTPCLSVKYCTTGRRENSTSRGSAINTKNTGVFLKNVLILPKPYPPFPPRLHHLSATAAPRCPPSAVRRPRSPRRRPPSSVPPLLPPSPSSLSHPTGRHRPPRRIRPLGGRRGSRAIPSSSRSSPWSAPSHPSACTYTRRRAPSARRCTWPRPRPPRVRRR